MRRMNGISCAMSGVFAPSRAMTIASPALNTNWSTAPGHQQPADSDGYCRSEQDDDQRAHREEQLLELLEQNDDGQRGAREVQRPHEPEVAGDGAGAGQDRALR